MQKKEKRQVFTCLFLAEKEGFEPSRPFRSLHDFQSCALDQLGDFSIRDSVVVLISEQIYYSKDFSKVKHNFQIFVGFF